MATKMAMAMLFTLLGGVSAGTCAAGDKFKATLTDLFCSSATMTAAHCPNCCEGDPLKCGGITGISCPAATHYQPTSTEAWENTPTTEANKNTDCCTARATCGSTFSCPAGMKLKTAAGTADVKCPTDAASCAGTLSSSTCCEPDDTTCGGLNQIAAFNCPDGHYNYNSASMATWQGTAATDADKTTKCCTAQATCGDGSTFTIPAGMKLKEAAGTADVKCPTDAASCAGMLSSSTCCEPDETTCGGLNQIAAFSCANTHYNYIAANMATWQGTAATDANKATNCCTEKAKCGDGSGYTITAGMKLKTAAGTADEACTNDAASCVSTCLENDPLKCGGIGGITCTNGFKGTDADWLNKATTASTKNNDCCTASATCAAFQTEVTTTTASGDASNAPLSQPTIFYCLVSFVVVMVAI